MNPTERQMLTRQFLDPLLLAAASGEPTRAEPPHCVRRMAAARRNDPCPCGSGKKYKRCKCSSVGMVLLRRNA